MNTTQRVWLRPGRAGNALLGLLLFVATVARAVDDAPPDKSGYHLLNPTPKELVREMNTDRPDKTESAYTVDAGHFQLEMDLFNYTRDHDTASGANTVTESFSIAPFNLKVGLCNSVDFQVVFDTYTRERVKDRLANTTMRQSGFGNLTTRMKINLWGNDGGTTAFALMPFMTFPTHQHDLGSDGLEGGLILPLAVELPLGWSMGVMTEFDCIRNSGRKGSHAEFINSITFSHTIFGALDGYVEFFSLVSGERDSRWIGTVDVGLTYGLTDNIQLDCGVNFGVTRSADDVNPFVGFSIRF